MSAANIHGLGSARAPAPQQPAPSKSLIWQIRAAQVASIALPILLVAGVLTATAFLPGVMGVAAGGIGAYFGYTVFSIALGMGAWHTAPKIYNYFNTIAENLKSRQQAPASQPFSGVPHRLPAAAPVAPSVPQPPAPQQQPADYSNSLVFTVQRDANGRPIRQQQPNQ